MTYAELAASPSYVTKHAGAGIEVILVEENNPGAEVIGAVTGLNVSMDFEAVAIEEAGNEVASDQVQGRVGVACNINAFWTPQWGDLLPDTSDFLGKKYTVIAQIGPNWPHAGTVLDVITGCALTRLNRAHGARGARTMDLSFAGIESLKGQTWSSETGT